MPANTGAFFKFLTEISNFEIVETNDFMTDLFDLPHENPINEKFETIGLESRYFINNLGIFAFALAFKVMIFIVWIAFYPIKNCSKWLQEKHKRFEAYIFWNTWIITINESFLIVGLIALAAFEHSFKFEA